MTDVTPFTGTVKTVRYYKPEQGGFCILMMEIEKPAANGRPGRLETVTVKGEIGFEPIKGKRLSFSGIATSDARGAFIKIMPNTVLEDLPRTEKGVIAWLSGELEGVGVGLAKRIVDYFGVDHIYDVLDHHIDRLMEVEGIGKVKFDVIASSARQRTGLRNLVSFLSGFGIGQSVSQKIFATYEDRSESIVRSNPYGLTEIRGIGFKTADEVAKAIGVSPDDPKRIQSAVRHCLEEISDSGHTMTAVSDLVAATKQLTGLMDDDLVLRQINVMVNQKQLSIREADTEDPHLSLAWLAASEKGIARELLRLMTGTGPDTDMASVARSNAHELSDPDQESAVEKAFLSGISVITGRPGCGKTTVTKFIARTAHSAGLRVVVCAPTGKAARRIEEATGFKAGTMHAELGFRPDGFFHDEDNPLTGDVFILDETSMADTHIAYSFLRAIPTGARIVLVGDADQLPSVAPGNFLRDIIDSSRIPVTHLTTIHRTAMNSDIVQNAHKIINGDARGVNLNGRRDFLFTKVKEDAGIVESILEVYLDMVDRFGIDNVQVLASMRKDPGVNALNREIRKAVDL